MNCAPGGGGCSSILTIDGEGDAGGADPASKIFSSSDSSRTVSVLGRLRAAEETRPAERRASNGRASVQRMLNEYKNRESSNVILSPRYNLTEWMLEFSEALLLVKRIENSQNWLAN